MKKVLDIRKEKCYYSVCGFEGMYLLHTAQWLSWLERRPVTAKVVGSSPIWVVWGLSSAGRASALQAEGHRFEPYRSHLTEYGEIAQLARAHGSYPWCRGFKSPSRYLFFLTR